MNSKREVVSIDGSSGEGGGQVIRTSLALSMITGTPIRITKIRQQRKPAGLGNQHVTCVAAAAEICQAQVKGNTKGSSDLQFIPGPVRSGDYEWRINTAGSTTLVWQTVALALARVPGLSSICIHGGTYNLWAPPVDYLEFVYIPLLRRLGVSIDWQTQQPGFYPQGGGCLTSQIVPLTEPWQPFDILERGVLVDRTVTSWVARLPRSVAERELQTFTHEMPGEDWQTHIRTATASGPANVLLARLTSESVCEVFTQFGKPGLPAEQVAKNLAVEVRDYLDLGHPLGPHLADQWMLPLALAVVDSGLPGSFRTGPLSLHSETQWALIQKFLPIAGVAQQLGPHSIQFTWHPAPQRS